MGKFLSQEEGITTPEKLSLPIPIQALASSHNYFSMFLDIKGNVWACGSARYGQLGLKMRAAGKSKHLPKMIRSLPAITDISAGYYHTLFLDEHMHAWATGYNAYGQLGLGKSKKHTFSPKRLTLPVTIKKVSAGSFHSLFLDTNEQVWACGHNKFGQLALGNCSNVDYPQLCPGLPAIQLICGGAHCSTFVDVDGQVWKCGVGSKSVAELQERFEGIQYAECAAHDIFLDEAGNVWVAGANSQGQLGLGESLLTEGIIALQKLECLPDLAWEQSIFKKTKSARIG